MNFYRIAYEYPHTNKRARITICVEPHEALPWAAAWCKRLKAYLLSIQEIRKADINDELMLS